MSPEVIHGPISPAEVGELKTQQIPGEVFEVFNSLIAQNLNRGCSTVLQKDVLSRLEQKGIESSKIFSNKWLDVEDSYREQGWKVTYDRPAYYAGENYEPFYEFDSRGSR